MKLILPLVVFATLFAAPAEVIRGTATFYCSDGRDGSPESACTVGYGPDDLVAAIDPKIGFGKGDFVRVRYAVAEGKSREVTVRIVDVCACRGPRVIDLTIGAFQRLAPWGMGVLPVRLELARAPRSTLPATDA